MAANAQWTAFMGLLDIDGANNDERGVAARTLKSAMQRYMSLRFGTPDTYYLVDIVNAQPVIAAVTTNIQHVNTDAAAIKTAVETVVPSVKA
jgi:hypothetical protein